MNCTYFNKTIKACSTSSDNTNDKCNKCRICNTSLIIYLKPIINYYHQCEIQRKHFCGQVDPLFKCCRSQELALLNMLKCNCWLTNCLMQQSPLLHQEASHRAINRRLPLFTAVLPAASQCKIKSSDKGNIWFNLSGIHDANVQTWFDWDAWIYIQHHG